MIKYPEYDGKSPEELKKDLEALKAQIAEIDDERELVLSQSGQHIQSTIYVDKFETEKAVAEEKIAYIESLLA